MSFDYQCLLQTKCKYQETHSKDVTTNMKVAKSSNNKIACIFEAISFRTHVNQTFSSCFDQYYLLSKYVTPFLDTLYIYNLCHILFAWCLLLVRFTTMPVLQVLTKCGFLYDGSCHVELLSMKDLHMKTIEHTPPPSVEAVLATFKVQYYISHQA